MVKDTSEMLKELENFSNFKDFMNENGDNIAKKDLSENLNALLLKYGIKNSLQ